MSLVLSRKAGEAVILAMPDGKKVRVEVDRRCRLVFEADADIVILRAELTRPKQPRSIDTIWGPM